MSRLASAAGGGCAAVRARAAGDALPLAGLVAGAVALRLLTWQRTAAIQNDGPVFLGLARLLREGEWAAALAHAYHPLYPAGTALLEPVFRGAGAGSYERAAAALSIVAGGAAVALLFVFLRAAIDRRTAWIGALCLAVHPYAVAYGSDVQSDGLYLALFLLAVLLLWGALERGGAARAAAAGAASGLAYLTRPEGLGVALVGLALAGGQVLWGRWPLRRAAVFGAALVAGAALLAGPYALQLRAQSGQWTLTQKKAVLELGGLDVRRARTEPVAPGGALLAASPFLETVIQGPRSGAGAAGPGPPPPRLSGPRALAAGAEVVSMLWSALRPELFGLAVLGVVARRRGRELPFVLALVGFYALLLYGLAFGAGYVDRRHALPPAVLLLGFAAAGVPVLGAGLLRALRLRSRPGLPAGLPVALGLALVLGFAAPKLAQPRRQERLAERRAAEWVRAQGERGAAVAAAKQRVAYYADAPYVPLPSNGSVPLLAYLRSAGARYVIVDDQALGESDALRSAGREGLRMVHRARAGGRSAAVFRVEPPAARGVGGS